MFCYDGLPFFWRLSMFVAAVAISALLIRGDHRWTSNLSRRVGALARRPFLAMACIFAVSIAVNLLLSVVQYPQPKIHDEFAYQLAADTYAQGKLANETHPHWKHFETFHVISQPTYSPKYPPANGFALAAGQLLTGHSIVGSWLALATGLACMFWMLYSLIPRRWALLGCLLLTINAPLLLAWGQTWWGGGAALAGGALLFGALRRLTEPEKWSLPTWWYSTVFATGCTLVVLSRPFEGFVACAVAGVVLLISHLRLPQTNRLATVCQLLIPVVLIGAAGVAFLASNNKAVTGSYTTLPYSCHSKQYSATSMWIWQKPPEIKHYNLPRMKSLYVNWSRARQLSAQKTKGYVELLKLKLNLLWRFFPLCGGLALLTLPFMPGRQRRWFVFSAVLIGCVLLVELQMVHSYTYPHYVAPFACLFYAMLFAGLRSWKIVGRRSKPARLVLPSIVIYSVLGLAGTVGQTLIKAGDPTPRAIAESKLNQRPGPHLVFVKYGPRHNPLEEWVYNRADIDGSGIVWANILSATENTGLIDYYPDRKIWIWSVDEPDSPLVELDRNRELTAAMR